MSQGERDSGLEGEQAPKPESESGSHRRPSPAGIISEEVCAMCPRRVPQREAGYLSVHFHPSLVEGCAWGVKSSGTSRLPCAWVVKPPTCPRQWRNPQALRNTPVEKHWEAGSQWGVCQEPLTTFLCCRWAELARETRGRVSEAPRLPPATPQTAHPACANIMAPAANSRTPAPLQLAKQLQPCAKCLICCKLNLMGLE